MNKLALLFFLFFAKTTVAQEIPLSDDSEANAKKSIQHKLLPSGLPDELNCNCPRHLASKSNLPRRIGFNPAGVSILDSIPSEAEIIQTIRLADLAAADSLENIGYKRFYAMMSLKAQALDCGANALSNINQTIQGDSLIFTATALRVERK
jgi:hypothetical protein